MLQKILSALPPRVFYEKLLGTVLPQENERGDVFINCPFHEKNVGKPDDKASMSVSLLPDRAGVYHCFGCGASGTLVQFFQTFHNLEDEPLRTVITKLIETFDLDHELLERELVDEKTIIKWMNDLHSTEEGARLLTHLVEARQLSLDVISQMRLGLHHNGRLAIPVFDADGAVVNVRQWLPEYKRKTDSDTRHKMIGIAGVNFPRLYPYSALRGTELILCEGELDCLALRSLGFNAVTNCAAIDKWPKTWYRYFADKDIIILFDSDQPGIDAADKLLVDLAEVAKHIKVVHLKSEADKTGFDVTDFISKLEPEGASTALRALFDETPWFYFKSEHRDNYLRVNLFSAANAEVINKKIELKAKIASKDAEPFAVPHTVTLRCDAEKPSKKCPGCPQTLFDSDEVTRTVELDSDLVLGLLSSGKQQHAVLNRWFQTNCSMHRFDITKYSNVETLKLIPEVDLSADAYEHVVRSCVYCGYGLRMNQTYIFRGRTVIDPDTQRVVHVFNEATPADSLQTATSPHDVVAIDGVEAPMCEHLKRFRPRKNQLIREKLFEIYLDFEVNVVRIWQRKDLIQAYDLTYHSPLHFYFGEEFIHQGWMSTLVVGDTQCGKTKTLINLQQHFNAGQILSGESVSRAGIMGGFIEMPGRRGTQYMLGVFPLNDGGLVAIDEFSGLSPEEIGELTLLRSYGKTMVTKQAQHFEFPARVRTIMLSNPRDGRSVNSFPQGVQAIQKLIGSDADTARFDLFVVVASDEVPLSDINTGVQQNVEHQYTADLSHLLLKWVWSRKASDYEFTEPAKKAVLEQATRMAEVYDSSIPIVVPGSQRWTIARVAAAIAARLFSTDESYRRVIVEGEHVDAAVEFLYECYNKPSMGYHVFSARKLRENTLQHVKTIKRWLESWPWQVADQLYQLNRFTKSELANVTGLDDFSIKEIVSNLVKVGAVHSRNNYFYLNPGFRKFLEKFEHPKYGRLVEMMEGDAGETEIDVN